MALLTVVTNSLFVSKQAQPFVYEKTFEFVTTHENLYNLNQRLCMTLQSHTDKL